MKIILTKVKPNKIFWNIILMLISSSVVKAQPGRNNDAIQKYNVTWESQSKDATGSMPLGAGSLGLNVWVENNDLLIYIGHPDSRKEDQKLMKLGRVRISFSPNPFAIKFRQHLNISESNIEISGITANQKPVKLKLWVDVFNPMIHINMKSEEAHYATIAYESWFFNAEAKANEILWNYKLDNSKIDLHQKIKEQKLEGIAGEIHNYLENLIMGGKIVAKGFVPAEPHSGTYMKTPYKSWRISTERPLTQFDCDIAVRVENDASINAWKSELDKLSAACIKTKNQDYQKSIQWWNQFWSRSHVIVNPGKTASDTAWQVGRNYQLFRYMLAMNSSGKFPTLFNGGTLIFDNPIGDGKAYGNEGWNPDERNWWGCHFMAQNQRLVYWPMIKNGDEDLLKIGLDYYRDRTELGKARAKHFLDVDGVLFHESTDVYGLIAACADGSGLGNCEHLTYHFTSSLEFAYMMLENYRFHGKELKNSMPMIMGVLKLYDNLYQKINLKNSGKQLDKTGKLVIYPGNSCEYAGGTTNHADAVAGLMALTNGLLSLKNDELTISEKKWLVSFKQRIPPIPVKMKNGKQVIAIADSLEKIHNPNEFPQLYTMFPFQVYGMGLPGLDIARNTWYHGADNDTIQKEFMCWKYPNIGVAMLGLTDEAKYYAVNKFLYPLKSPLMAAGGYGDCAPFKSRFPAFWVTYPFCAFPDMDHGGSAMIGLQEMLMQTPGDKIMLLPSWPKEWNVNFKLHAPGRTVVQGELKDGKLVNINVSPQSRLKDIILSPGWQMPGTKKAIKPKT